MDILTSINSIHKGNIFMKYIYLMVYLFVFLFTGCSSTYTIKDFSSKEKFYNDFNNSVKNKSVEITFINDSSFTLNSRVAVEGDSLYSLNPFVSRTGARISLSELKEIKYTGFDNSSAALTLKDGEVL